MKRMRFFNRTVLHLLPGDFHIPGRSHGLINDSSLLRSLFTRIIKCVAIKEHDRLHKALECASPQNWKMSVVFYDDG